MAIAHKGRRLSPEHRDHLRISLIGRPVSASTRAKISSALQGHGLAPESRAKLSASLKTHWQRNYERLCRSQGGRYFSPERLAQLSIAGHATGYQKGHAVSAETRKKISAANKGRTLTPEQRAKLSAALKGRPTSLAHRANLAAALTGKRASAATRAKLSASHKNNPAAARATARALALHPNKLERRVLAVLIDTFPDDGWQFNPGVTVHGKVPDFVRSDGVKLAVDVHGDYWHRDDTPAICRARQEIFRSAGWQLVILWEHEFNGQPTLLKRRVVRAAKSIVQ
ncbi:MAG: NUMOD3 domain-containing DNA-binding protein [Deltaproteobacteria bacterium]|nr:NUMOD3 domain-containing DNA-binding protein [Deltaproteobacteria bacterium]